MRKNIRRKQAGLIAAGPGANFDHRRFVILGVFRQKLETEFFLGIFDQRFVCFKLFTRHGNHIRVIGTDHLAGFFYCLANQPIATPRLQHIGQLTTLTIKRNKPLLVTDHSRIREGFIKRRKALF